MSVMCGICRRALRGDDNPKRVRLDAADMKDMKYPTGKEPGLYSACSDCHELYLPVVAARLGKTVETMATHDAI